MQMHLIFYIVIHSNWPIAESSKFVSRGSYMPSVHQATEKGSL